MLINDACHCGDISFTLDWQPEPAEIPARACTCSFCLKHGGVWTSCPTGSLTVHIKDAGHVSGYAFGVKTAQFHVCSACGVVPVVTNTIEGTMYAVVSVNAFNNVPPGMPRRGSVSFEGEDTGERLTRRQRNWIAQVTVQSEC